MAGGILITVGVIIIAGAYLVRLYQQSTDAHEEAVIAYNDWATTYQVNIGRE